MLRGELHFDGAIVSDWGAAGQNKEGTLAAGMDLIQPGPNDMTACKQAVQEGRLSEEVLNDRVTHILQLIVEIKQNQRRIPAQYDADALLQTACRTIEDGAVLLKNENGVLPLAETQRVVFWGARSRDTLECGSGSTAVETALHSNVLDEYRKLRGAAAFEEWTDADTLVYTAAAPAGEKCGPRKHGGRGTRPHPHDRGAEAGKAERHENRRAVEYFRTGRDGGLAALRGCSALHLHSRLHGRRGSGTSADGAGRAGRPPAGDVPDSLRGHARLPKLPR